MGVGLGVGGGCIVLLPDALPGTQTAAPEKGVQKGCTEDSGGSHPNPKKKKIDSCHLNNSLSLVSVEQNTPWLVSVGSNKTHLWCQWNTISHIFTVSVLKYALKLVSVK